MYTQYVGLDFGMFRGRGTGAPKLQKFLCQFFGETLNLLTPTHKGTGIRYAWQHLVLTYPSVLHSYFRA